MHRFNFGGYAQKLGDQKAGAKTKSGDEFEFLSADDIKKLVFHEVCARRNPNREEKPIDRLYEKVLKFYERKPGKDEVLKIFEIYFGLMDAAVLSGDSHLLKLSFDIMDQSIEDPNKKLEILKWGFRDLLDQVYNDRSMCTEPFWKGYIARDLFNYFFQLIQKNKNDKLNYLATCEWDICGAEFKDFILKIARDSTNSETREALSLICDHFVAIMPTMENNYFFAAFIAFLTMRNGPKDNEYKLLCYARLFKIDMSQYKSIEEFFAANYQKNIFPEHDTWSHTLVNHLWSTTFAYFNTKPGSEELFNFCYWSWKNAEATKNSYHRKEWLFKVVKHTPAFVFNETRVRELIKASELVQVPEEYDSYQTQSAYREFSDRIKVLKSALDRYYQPAEAKSEKSEDSNIKKLGMSH